MTIGPSPGNGFIWTRGPYTLGLWVDNDQGGFGMPLVLGHKDGPTWVVDGSIRQEDEGGWRNLITAQAHGQIGTFYIANLLPLINADIELLYPLNPHSNVPVQQTDAWTKDIFNALIAQFTKADQAGKLEQGP